MLAGFFVTRLTCGWWLWAFFAHPATDIQWNLYAFSVEWFNRT